MTIIIIFTYKKNYIVVFFKLIPDNYIYKCDGIDKQIIYL